MQWRNQLKTEPNNQYSKIVHKHQTENIIQLNLDYIKFQDWERLSEFWKTG